MTNPDIEGFLWVCPEPKCREFRLAKVKHSVLLPVDEYCPIHQQPFMVFSRVVKQATQLALNFTFDQEIKPPLSLLKYFARQPLQMYKELTKNWILTSTAVRTSPRMAIYYEMMNRTQYRLSNLWFRWTKDRQRKQALINATRKQLQQLQAEFIQSTVAQTAAYVPPQQWQPPFPLNLDPMRQWYAEIWPNLRTMIQEAQDPIAYELTPNRHKALLDLLLTARTVDSYLHLSPVYEDTAIFDLPGLVTRFAEFARTPGLVKRLTAQEFTQFLDHLPTFSSSSTTSLQSSVSSNLRNENDASYSASNRPLNSNSRIKDKIEAEKTEKFMIESETDSENDEDRMVDIFTTATTGHANRSYKMGIQAELPSGLFADISDPDEKLALQRAAKGVLRRTLANYVLNSALIPDSIAAGFAPQVVATRPNLHLHYGNLRSITNTAANIADSAHYYLQIHTKGYQDLEQKVRDFDTYLHQDPFLLNIAQYLYTGYCGSYLLTTLTGRWNVSRFWVTALLRGWRKRYESSLPLPFHRTTQRDTIAAFWQQIQQQFGIDTTLIAKAQRNHWFPVLLQADPAILSRIIPPTDLPLFQRLFQQFHTTYATPTQIHTLLQQIAPVSITFFQFTIPILQHAIQTCLQAVNSGIQALATRNGNPQYLQAQRNKFSHLMNSPAALTYLAQFPWVDASYRTCKTLAAGLPSLVGHGKWEPVLAQLFAVASFEQFYQQVAQLPTLNPTQVLTIPFQSPTRKTHRIPIILTSPKYVFKRPNAADITTKVATTGQFSMAMPRRAVTRTEFLQANGSLLSSQHQAQVLDEISWGTSTKPQNVALRQQLQQDPFFLLLLGVPNSQLSRAQRQQLTQNPGLTAQVQQSRLTMRVMVPKSVRSRIQRGARVQQVMVLPSTKPSKNFQLILQMEGPTACFDVVPKRVPHLPPRPFGIAPVKMGCDTNALSASPLEFAGLDNRNHRIALRLPPRVKAQIHRFCRWNGNLKRVEDEIGKLQGNITRFPQSPSCLRWKEQIRLLHQRRAGIKQQVDQHAAWVLFEVYTIYRPAVLGLENLATLRTNGKRGALAKIVNYMVKRQAPIVSQVETWLRACGQQGKLELVDPRHTSDRHFGCGSKVVRQGDRGFCQRCGARMKIHHNAALNIAARTTP